MGYAVVFGIGVLLGGFLAIYGMSAGSALKERTSRQIDVEQAEGLIETTRENIQLKARVAELEHNIELLERG